MTNCPNCGKIDRIDAKIQGFKVVSQCKVKKRRKSFFKNGENHLHDCGVSYEELICLKCGCYFRITSKIVCFACGYNERYKPQVIIIKKGKDIRR